MEHSEQRISDAPLAAQLGATTPAPAPEASPIPDEQATRGAGVQLDRFAEKTRQILASAAEQARQLGHREIRPEHLFLALLLEPGA